MWTAMAPPVTAMVPERTALGEGAVLGRERWEEVRRVAAAERLTISALARRFDLDRKTVRRGLRHADVVPDPLTARDGTAPGERGDEQHRPAPARAHVDLRVEGRVVGRGGERAVRAGAGRGGQ